MTDLPVQMLPGSGQWRSRCPCPLATRHAAVARSCRLSSAQFPRSSRRTSPPACALLIRKPASRPADAVAPSASAALLLREESGIDGAMLRGRACDESVTDPEIGLIAMPRCRVDP